MRTLVLTAHPDPDSPTHHAAGRVQELLGADAVVGHLAQEGFDPRFTAHDRRDHLDRDRSDPAVLAEQRRVDRAQHLVLVFPVYWWSMPALLKGWVDRVLIGGWAFDHDEQDRVVPRLGRLTAHLLPISGTSASSSARHGYARAFSTQVEQGVVDFCGIGRGVTAFVHDSESGDRDAVLGAVESAASRIVAAVEVADGDPAATG